MIILIKRQGGQVHLPFGDVRGNLYVVRWKMQKITERTGIISL